MGKLVKRLFLIDNLFLGILGVLLYFYNVANHRNFLVLNPIYFYKNRFDFQLFSNTPDYNIFRSLNSGFVGQLYSHLYSSMQVPDFAGGVLCALLGVQGARLLLKYARYWITGFSSLLLVAIIFFTPMVGDLRQIFSSSENSRFYGLLYGNLPSPQFFLVALIGFLLFLHESRLSRVYPFKKALLLAMLLFFVHPFLFILFVVCFYIQIKILHSRGLGFVERDKTSILLFFLNSLLLISFVSFVLHMGRNYLGSFTVAASARLDVFELGFYLVLPTILLLLSLYYINISFYELLIKFFPIFVFFCLETILLIVSVLMSRNLIWFLEINGLSQFFHVIYYLPSIYLMLSFSRRQKIKWLAHFKLGAVAENSLTLIISFVSAVLLLAVSATTIGNSVSFFSNLTYCKDAKLLVSIFNASKTSVDSQRQVEVQLLKVRLGMMNSREFRNFMRNPDQFKGTVFSRYQNCSLNGVGFMLLNGFVFDDRATLRAIDFVNRVEEQISD